MFKTFLVLCRVRIAAMKRWVEPVISFQKLRASFRLYIRYLADWNRYKNLPSAEFLRLEDSYPCLFDRTEGTPYDPHYFHQAAWAMGRIAASQTTRHLDVGSDVRFVGMLTTHTQVTFIDVRPLKVDLIRLNPVAGSIAALPLGDGSITSLSCLHVVEHVGLGRYGDQLDPLGTRRACKELTRVLAPGANLFVSLPVGRPRVCFNAHRVHSPLQVLSCFEGLELIEFSAVDDRGKFREKADLDEMGQANYACGLFWFKLAKTPS